MEAIWAVLVYRLGGVISLGGKSDNGKGGQGGQEISMYQ